MENYTENINILKSYFNTVIKITYLDFRNEQFTEIGKLVEINEKFKFIEIGHPIKFCNNANGYIIKNIASTCAGRHAIYYDNINGSIINIENISKDEFEEWKLQYRNFHHNIIKIYGNDLCEENLNETYS